MPILWDESIPIHLEGETPLLRRTLVTAGLASLTLPATLARAQTTQYPTPLPCDGKCRIDDAGLDPLTILLSPQYGNGLTLYDPSSGWRTCTILTGQQAMGYYPGLLTNADDCMVENVPHQSLPFDVFFYVYAQCDPINSVRLNFSTISPALDPQTGFLVRFTNPLDKSNRLIGTTCRLSNRRLQDNQLTSLFNPMPNDLIVQFTQADGMAFANTQRLASLGGPAYNIRFPGWPGGAFNHRPQFEATMISDTDNVTVWIAIARNGQPIDDGTQFTLTSANRPYHTSFTGPNPPEPWGMNNYEALVMTSGGTVKVIRGLLTISQLY
jgi:hypothetical protein